MSRQGSGFPGHRERREGHPRSYGIGSWYGTGDYYTVAANSNDYGLPPKRPRYGDRYKDRHENANEGMQFSQQDGDYGLYTDFSSTTENDQQVSVDPSTGRNFVSRRPASDYHHTAHRIPKNFWSSENAVHQSPYAASTAAQMRHQSGYVHDSQQSSRGDSNYSWRTHAYPPKNSESRSKPIIYPEADSFDELRQRSGWFRSEDGRNYSGRGRALHSSKTPTKFSIQRELPKPGVSHHGRKYSDSEPGPAGLEMHANQKGNHLAKRPALYAQEKKPEAIQRVDMGQRHHRGEDARERRFYEGKPPYGGNLTRDIGHDSKVAGVKHEEDIRSRATDKRKCDGNMHSEDRIAHGDLLDKAHVLPTEVGGISENPSVAAKAEGKQQPQQEQQQQQLQQQQLQQQPHFENVSPVPGHDDGACQPSGPTENDFVGAMTAFVPHTKQEANDGKEVAEISNSTESRQEEFTTSVEATQVGNYQPPESEEEVISKLDSMDKEIVECEEDIKNLEKIEIQLEKELIELKKEIEDADNEKQKEEQTLDNRDEKDPKDELMDYFIDKFRPKDFELVVKIYKDNQIKAKLSHAGLWPSNFVSTPSSKPLYYQPSDLPFYFDNIRRHKRFRMKLIKFLQMKKIAQNKKEDIMKELYEQQKETWLKKLERIENNIRRKAKLSKVRAFYEREFPEIKRQREQQERMTRLGSRTTWGPLARSEAEFEEIVDNLSELEATEKQMHQLAVEPPKLLDRYERRVQYSNKNGLIVDLEAFERERKFKNIWCEEEKAIFKERFMLYPKDFEKIAEGLKRKTVSECVLYYYRNKKKENFKATSKKPSRKTGRLQRQLVSTLTYAQPLPNIQDLQQPQPVKTRQKEREREREKQKEQDQQKDQAVERLKSLRSEQENPDKNEGRRTRELRSSDEKSTEQAEPCVANDVAGNKLVTHQMEAQCKQTVDDLIARYLARKPLPAENVDPSRWSDIEISKAIEGLKCHGRNWPAISRMVNTKSEAQCKNFYFNYKRKFHLESILGISKHPITSFQREGTGSSNEDDVISKKRRAKKTAQQERDSNEVDAQVGEQYSQDKPVDVEEIEIDQSTQEESTMDVQESESAMQEDKEIDASEQTMEQTVVVVTPESNVERAETREQARKIVIKKDTDGKENRLSEEVSVLSHTSRSDAKRLDSSRLKDEDVDAESCKETIAPNDNIVPASLQVSSVESSVAFRPDSLRISDVFAQTKAKEVDPMASVRTKPPPLTPVLANKAVGQSSDADKAGSPSSVLKGISLQGEIGAFRETLERTLEKKNELNKNPAAASYREGAGENQKQFPASTSYPQQQGERLAAQLPSQRIPQTFHDAHKHVEAFSFKQSSLHPSLEQSAAIQAFAVRQPSLMSVQQSQAKQFGHLSQEAVAIQKHYQHPHMTQARGSSQGKKSPSAVGHVIHTHRSSPKTSTSVAVDSRGNHQFVSSRPSHFMFPAATSQYTGIQSSEQVRHSSELKYPSITDYSSMSHQGMLFTNAANPNELFLRHSEHFEGYRHPLVSQSGERAYPYMEANFSMSASDARTRTYGELLERSASIPSLRHSSADAPRPNKSLSKDNISHIGQQARDKGIFPIDPRQPHMYYETAMGTRERIDTRSLNRREQIMTEQMHNQNLSLEHQRHIREENVRGSNHGTDSPKHQSGLSTNTPSAAAMDHRIPHYLPSNLHSHIPQFMRERESRPTLDQQLLQSIDGRKAPGSIYHHPSGLHPDSKATPRIAELPPNLDDYRKQQIILEPIHRGDHRALAELQHMQGMREAKNRYEKRPSSVGVASAQSSDPRQKVPSESTTPPERHYGISTGLAARAPAHMSITGARESHDDIRLFGKSLPLTREGSPITIMKHEELEYLRERGIIPTKRTSAIKNQSKNTRPSSVDSVIHRSFLTERQQQLSSSLGDLRNLSELHLSPSLPISPVSASHTSKKTFMFRPWERAETEEDTLSWKDAPSPPAATQSLPKDKVGLLKVGLLETGGDERRSSTGVDSTYDEPLMSPTIPYTDRARDTPVKDITSSTGNSPSFFAAESTLGSITPTTEEGKVYYAPPVEPLKRTPNSASDERPQSPVDSEATLSADEAEMEMMRETLHERERSANLDDSYRDRETAEAGISPVPNIGELGSFAAPEKVVDLEVTVNKIALVKDSHGGFEKIQIERHHEQHDLSADLEVSKITDQQEQIVKGKRKQKSGPRGKKKSPKRIDQGNVDETMSGVKAEKSHITSTLLSELGTDSSGVIPSFLPRSEAVSEQAISLPETNREPETARTSGDKNEPVQIPPPVLNVTPVSLFDDVTSSAASGEKETTSVAEPEEDDMKASGPEGEEKISNESDGLNDSQNITDFEETSAAIDSIQNESRESPSAEEDTAEPFLTLWPTAEYPCEAQSVSNAVEAEYHAEYDPDAGDQRVLTDEDTGLVRESAGIAMELQTRLTIDMNLGFQQAQTEMLPAQTDNDIFLPETTPISPPGSPISPVEIPAVQPEMTSSDAALSFSHSVLSLSRQDSLRAPFPYSTLSFPYSTLSSMPASRPGSLHGSGSSSACHSPNPLGSMQSSPSYAASSANLTTRPDFQSGGQHSDNLRNLTEKLLNNDIAISQDDHMTLEVTNRTTDSSGHFSPTITYEPLSDED